MPDNSEYTLADMIEDEDDPRIIDSLRVEKSIVDEVRRTTGLSYRFIEGMPTDQADVAEAVLPILAVHLASGVEPAIRWGIYSRFCTKHARPYLGLLVSQLPRE